MKHNNENKTINFESVTILKAVYEQIIKILNALANRNFEQRDYELNSLYGVLTSIGSKVLSENKKFFDKYDIQQPTIPENLIGDIEDIDVLWENKINPKTHEFLGKIEDILLEAHNPKYELMPELKDLFKKIDGALDRIVRQDDDDFAKLAAEKLDKNPFIKSEDKLIRPKVNRRLKAGSLTIDFTVGTLQYDNNPPVKISPNKIEIRFLAFLMSNQRIVEYEELGKEILCNSSNALPRDVQFLKRNLLAYLRKGANMPTDQVKAISKMIEAIQGDGYILRLT
ncbi:hypothetical protein KKE78_01695 [Patescibacteria group bacterium]|nr:hypothetical protein [Patescibacteria group bacterium]